MASTTRLIVNADDLGMTAGVNAGIFEAHRRGLVTSAGLMVNFAGAEAAAAELADHPELGVGLHLALSRGRPVLPPARVPSLVDGDGRLPERPEQHRAPAPAEVLAEARAQMARFRQLTRRLPTHIDGHHHCHRLPVVSDAVIRVAAELKLPVRAVSAEHRARLVAAGVPAPDLFVDRFFGPGATLEALLEVLDGLAPGVTELMCHPGRVDAALRAGSSYVEERERELELLTDSRILAAARHRDVRLVHFGSLCGGHRQPGS